MQKEVGWLLKEKYHSKPTRQFEKDVQRLKRGEPLDYVIGFTEFLGCKIDLSEKPLIPRSETEFWVKEVIQQVGESTVLDIFAGSGCIGISIMRHIPDARVHFAEKDGTAVRQIKKNLKLNGMKQTKVFVSDVFSAVPGAYDYIFANPPYIPTKNKTKIQRSVLQHEPKVALFGGANGLFIIKKFLRQAKSHLNPGGKIFMEFDPPQKPAITKLLKQYGYAGWEFHKDQYGRWRWVSTGA